MADDDLMKLAADLSKAPAEAWPFVAKALEVTARNVKDSWNDGLGGRSSGGRLKHVGRSVDYDVTAAGLGGSSRLEAEIGPNLGRAQGSMAGWFEKGMRNIPATHPGQSALKANEDDFERGLLRAVDDGLRRVGL